jgi:hypothetical protein
MSSRQLLLGIIFIALARNDKVKELIGNLVEKFEPEKFKEYKPLNMLVLMVAFTIIFFILKFMSGENFFFQVSEKRTLGRNMPRDAVYTDDKGVSFEFDRIGSGMCSDGGCNSYGMIKGCPNGNMRGRGNTDDSVL